MSTSIFTPELFAEFCNRMAAGRSMRSVCRDPDMPSKSAVMEWLARDDYDQKHGIRKMYAEACTVRADILFDEIIDIADDNSRDVTIDEEGKETVDWDHIARSKLRIDARKWVVAKMNPKKYSDKIQQEITGKDGKDLVPEAIAADPVDVARRMLLLMAQAQKITSDAA